jgi:hypothetical protein
MVQTVLSDDSDAPWMQWLVLLSWCVGLVRSQHQRRGVPRLLDHGHLAARAPSGLKSYVPTRSLEHRRRKWASLPACGC